MNLRKFNGFACLALGLFAGLNVAHAAAGDRFAAVSVDLESVPERYLSAYNFFADGKNQVPNDGVLPYTLNTPLYTDYANKHRFVWMPDGTAATYDPAEAFDFPVGAVLIKTFGYLHDIRDPEKGERLIETRLLINKPEGWVGFSYKWNEEGTDAKLAVAGGRVDVSWIHYDGNTREVKGYIIPNMNECKQCHEKGGLMKPIGPQARHLNRTFDYEGGAWNQLLKWQETGYLEGAPDPETAPRMPVASDPETGSLNARARAYLDINCAHCHNPAGPAHMSGLDLSFSQEDAGKYGVFKAPIAAGRGSGGHRFGIEPKHPEKSILQHRMESVEGGVMMPPLPKRMVHDEGVALIREWIAAMDARVTEDNRVEILE